MASSRQQRKAASEEIIMGFDWGPGALTFFGPVITTDLGITPAHAEALNRAGLPVPPPVRCRFLIDTGADGGMVKHEFAEQAGLKLIDASVPIQGVGIDTSGKIYMGRIAFLVQSRVAPGITHHIAVDAKIMSGALESDRIDGLIGRDVLQHFEMRYHGGNGTISMRYLKPGR